MDSSWYVMRPQNAQAFGKPVPNGFLVQKGSTAMVCGSPKEKRDIYLRDKLVKDGILVTHTDPSIYIFATDYVFTSSSAAGGIIKDGNCSGPSSWKNVSTSKTLRDMKNLQEEI